MSTYFDQSVAYGYITTNEEADKILGDSLWEEDGDLLRLENNPNGIGWLITDNYAFYGKLLMSGEGYGNDSLLAAESRFLKLARPDADDFAKVYRDVEKMFGSGEGAKCDIYILGQFY